MNANERKIIVKKQCKKANKIRSFLLLSTNLKLI